MADPGTPDRKSRILSAIAYIFPFNFLVMLDKDAAAEDGLTRWHARQAGKVFLYFLLPGALLLALAFLLKADIALYAGAGLFGGCSVYCLRGMYAGWHGQKKKII